MCDVIKIKDAIIHTIKFNSTLSYHYLNYPYPTQSCININMNASNSSTIGYDFSSWYCYCCRLNITTSITIQHRVNNCKCSGSTRCCWFNSNHVNYDVVPPFVQVSESITKIPLPTPQTSQSTWSTVTVAITVTMTPHPTSSHSLFPPLVQWTYCQLCQ